MFGVPAGVVGGGGGVEAPRRRSRRFRSRCGSPGPWPAWAARRRSRTSCTNSSSRSGGGAAAASRAGSTACRRERRAIRESARTAASAPSSERPAERPMKRKSSAQPSLLRIRSRLAAQPKRAGDTAQPRSSRMAWRRTPILRRRGPVRLKIPVQKRSEVPFAAVPSGPIGTEGLRLRIRGDRMTWPDFRTCWASPFSSSAARRYTVAPRLAKRLASIPNRSSVASPRCTLRCDNPVRRPSVRTDGQQVPSWPAKSASATSVALTDPRTAVSCQTAVLQ